MGFDEPQGLVRPTRNLSEDICADRATAVLWRSLCQPCQQPDAPPEAPR